MPGIDALVADAVISVADVKILAAAAGRVVADAGA